MTKRRGPKTFHCPTTFSLSVTVSFHHHHHHILISSHDHHHQDHHRHHHNNNKTLLIWARSESETKREIIIIKWERITFIRKWARLISTKSGGDDDKIRPFSANLHKQQQQQLLGLRTESNNNNNNKSWR